MKNNIAACILLSFLLMACSASDDIKLIEEAVRSEVLKESAGIASLEAIYLVSYMHYQENLITSDDIYVQKDSVSIDYGFKIDESAIRVVADGQRKILQVRLKKGEALAVNRVSIENPESTHAGYRPKDKNTGEFVDVDSAMNKEIEQIKAEYESRNLKTAAENIKNFFKILATKYGLELDFQVEA